MDNLNSEFNYAVSYLQALRRIEDMCTYYSINTDYEAWMKCIKAFYREIHRRMTPEEQAEAVELIKRAEKTFASQTAYLSTTNGMAKEERLTEAETFLREIIKKRKMDLPTKEDPGKSLLDDKGF